MTSIKGNANKSGTHAQAAMELIITVRSGTLFYALGDSRFMVRVLSFLHFMPTY